MIMSITTNSLNSFAVISFNVNDPNASLRYEYLDISNRSSVLSAPRMPKILNEQTTIETSRNEVFRYRNNESFWVVNNDGKFEVCVTSSDLNEEDCENVFAGPFLSKFLAEQFINEIKNYISDDDGI